MSNILKNICDDNSNKISKLYGLPETQKIIYHYENDVENLICKNLKKKH